MSKTEGIQTWTVYVESKILGTSEVRDERSIGSGSVIIITIIVVNLIGLTRRQWTLVPSVLFRYSVSHVTVRLEVWLFVHSMSGWVVTLILYKKSSITSELLLKFLILISENFYQWLFILLYVVLRNIIFVSTKYIFKSLLLKSLYDLVYLKKNKKREYIYNNPVNGQRRGM